MNIITVSTVVAGIIAVIALIVVISFINTWLKAMLAGAR